MSREASKLCALRPRRIKYIKGRVLDVGCGPDPVAAVPEVAAQLTQFFPWDMPQGDAQELPNVPDDVFDTVHASHVLEHLVDPRAALRRWLQVTRPGGYVVVAIPDEDLYEGGVWPSRFNSDHKHTFTMAKAASWSPVSINVLDLCRELADVAETVLVERIEDLWNAAFEADVDQTQGYAPCAIEFVLRKLEPAVGP